MEGTRWKAGVYTALVLFALWSIYLYFYNQSLLSWITREDSVSESVSAICYLIAACIFFVEWVHGGFRNIFILGYALLIIGLLVVLMIAVLMPLTQRWIRSFRELYTRLMIPVIPLWTLPITILAFMFMAIPRVFWNKTVFTLDEVGELYLSLVFLLFAIAVRAASTKSRREPVGASEGTDI